MVLPGTALEIAAQIAERLRLLVKEMTIGDVNSITVSLGVASAPSGKSQTESILKKADEALYRAKKQGRDRVVTSL